MQTYIHMQMWQGYEIDGIIYDLSKIVRYIKREIPGKVVVVSCKSVAIGTSQTLTYCTDLRFQRLAVEIIRALPQNRCYA